MNFSVQRGNFENEFHVIDGDVHVGSFWRNYNAEITAVVVYVNRTTSIQQALFLAVILGAPQFNQSADELKLLNWALDHSVEELAEKVQDYNVDVIMATQPSLQAALDHAVDDLPVQCQVLSDNKFGNMCNVRFTVTPSDDPAQFRFWHLMHVGPVGWQLDIVPAYHPVRSGKEYAYMINGDTDAIITGKTMRSLYCPDDARRDPERRALFSSWNNTIHPAYAHGRSFVVELSAPLAQSAEGMADITKLLRAALELDNQYIAISGGFRPAENRYPYPGNLRPGDKRVRGSEASCAWMYHTLQAEGPDELAKAFIPGWFHTEKWDEAYASALSR